jgi:hypothetical protein
MMAPGPLEIGLILTFFVLMSVLLARCPSFKNYKQVIRHHVRERILQS